MNAPDVHDPPLSLVDDALGIYYDVIHPSRFESLIARPMTDEETARAQALIRAWRNGRVSEYNYARDYRILARAVRAGGGPDPDDASISYGMADESSFQRMLDAALAENRIARCC